MVIIDKGSVSKQQDKWGDLNYHILRVKDADELTSKQKEKVIDGFNKIIKIFGENWFREAAVANHPLIWYFRNLAPWTRFWLLDFGKKLDELKSLPNFEKLKNKLKTPQLFDASLAELEVAAKLKRASINVELYPKIDSGESDFKAVTDDTEIYIEVTTVGSSEEEMEAEKTYHELVAEPLVFNFNVESACKVHKILRQPQVRAAYRRKIKQVIGRVKNEQRCAEISEPVIDCIVCPKGKLNEVKQWMKEKGLTATYGGPPYHDDELKRIRGKIQKKVKQLPKDKPGVIVVFGNHLGWARGEEDYIQIANELEEPVYKHSRLTLGVVTTTNHLGSEESFIEKGNRVIVQKASYGILQENTIIIKNRNSIFPLNEEILNAFL